MKLELPNLPAWAWVALAAAGAAGSLGAELMWPRQSIGPPLEESAGFYAAAGFGAALIVLVGAWLARFLRDDAPEP